MPIVSSMCRTVDRSDLFVPGFINQFHSFILHIFKNYCSIVDNGPGRRRANYKQAVAKLCVVGLRQKT